MKEPILSPASDRIFKLLFGDERHKDMLVSLLKTFVELPEEEYELTFLDTHLKPETKDDKLGILDIKIKTKSGKIINIEIRINPEKNIGKRISFYKSKLIVGQINKNDNYSIIQKVICICILEKEYFPDKTEYLNVFRFYNPKNNLYFDNIPEEIHTLELSKLPAQSDGTSAWNWFKFLKAKTKEELEMVAQKNPEIRKAVNTLYELSSDEEIRAVYDQRLKNRLARNTEIYDAKVEGKMEGELKAKYNIAHNMKSMGMSLDHIVKTTGLTIQQIQAL